MANYWFTPTSVEFEVGGRTMKIETGRLAKQAAGATVVTYGESMVLVTVCRAKAREGIDFFPLVVDFIEKTSAAGKIPGGFFKREGRLSEKEILTSRFIDRAIRPLFPDGFRDEVQVTLTVLSADPDVSVDMPGFIGASAALMISEIPFLGPIAAARVGRVAGELIVNPTEAQLSESDFEFVVAGSRNALVMVEGEGDQISEAEVLQALKFGHDSLIPAIEAQTKLRELVGRPKIEVTPQADRSELIAKITALAEPGLREAVNLREKKARYKKVAEVEAEIISKFVQEFKSEKANFESLQAYEERTKKLRTLEAQVKEVLHDLHYTIVRSIILDGRRIDGRRTDEIRPIACEVGVIPRAHGTGLFTRGETQVLVYATLGSRSDEQLIDGLTAKTYKNFMLHYNFPPFSVGECKPLRGPGRREVGHGNLAERALRRMLPPHEGFPYTIRIVSETLESNGSSSMATVCGGTLALMDAGVKLKAPVAGIAMGLIQEGDRVAILSDILGDEDHLGDMDFKVTGTANGVTAVQMDIKIRELDWAVMERALEQARRGRLHILDCMASEVRDALGSFAGRAELSRYAPRVDRLTIKPDKIRELIGPGGKVIRAIQEQTGANINVEDTGEVTIFAPDADTLEQARGMVEDITRDAEVGKFYVGQVKRIADFGAFVEILPGKDGLIHVSQLAEGRVEKVTDVLSEGDEVLVKCIDIDPSGKIRLSRKEALAEAAARAAGR